MFELIWLEKETYSAFGVSIIESKPSLATVWTLKRIPRTIYTNPVLPVSVPSKIEQFMLISLDVGGRRGEGGSWAGPAECYVSWEFLLNLHSPSCSTFSKSLQAFTIRAERQRPVTIQAWEEVRSRGPAVRQRCQRQSEMSGVKKLRTVSRCEDNGKETMIISSAWNILKKKVCLYVRDGQNCQRPKCRTPPKHVSCKYYRTVIIYQCC